VILDDRVRDGLPGIDVRGTFSSTDDAVILLYARRVAFLNWGSVYYA
jgi:hypothetical protein